MSGYVYRQPDNFKEHLIKKIKGLFFPWLIFSNFNIALSAIISLKGERNLLSEVYWNFLQIRGEGDGLWFVAALFVAFIPFYFVIRYMKTQTAIVAAIILSLMSVLYSQMMNPALLPWGSSALPWHIEYIFQAMLWMVLGYYFKVSGERIFDRWNTFCNRCAISVIYICLILLPSANNTGIEIIRGYVQSIIGIALIIGICKICKKNWYVNYVGANTLILFALHGKVYAVLEFIFGKFPVYERILNNLILSSVFAIIMGLFLSVLLIIPAFIINRYFPWTLGRKNEQHFINSTKMAT